MTLYTKGLYLPAAAEDGWRICVTSRLTENDGITPVESLYKGQIINDWFRTLAPHEKAVGTWYRSSRTDEDWQVFTEHYVKKMRRAQEQRLIQFLAQQARSSDITLLCVEETHERCHRSILAGEIALHAPNLEVIHRA